MEEATEEKVDLRVGLEILRQCGGTMFLLAARVLAYKVHSCGIACLFGQEDREKADVFEVTLTPADTYEGRFLKWVGDEPWTGEPEARPIFTLLWELEDVYCDQLLPLFEEKTGIKTGIVLTWTSGPG